MSDILYLYMSFNFNVKTEDKGRKLLSQVEQEMDLGFKTDDIFNGNDNSWTFSGYFVLKSIDPKDGIIETLQRVNNIGYNWNVGSPNFEHEEYWQFLGHRVDKPQNFRISGINCSDFELTDRSPDYHRKTPLLFKDKVEILENKKTRSEDLNGKIGRIFAITGMDDDNIYWTYIVEINNEKFALSESDLLKIE